jgi:hypothetical protein
MAMLLVLAIVLKGMLVYRYPALEGGQSMQQRIQVAVAAPAFAADVSHLQHIAVH